MSPFAVTMYWPVLFDPAEPAFLDLGCELLGLGV
eukprot:CAMPEP_0169458240 /NCGR_PEP_ID=MMETSP1042-20121227/17333_1 /TAXON_ID=464988 /ORGANISM="Hemiselmis andersenii, Strain CCMP1180" /LENGTH=33 /DNA_ID= /DNA_START= /DNA_END= /DNA_ORIENTATION=